MNLFKNMNQICLNQIEGGAVYLAEVYRASYILKTDHEWFSAVV